MNSFGLKILPSLMNKTKLLNLSSSLTGNILIVFYIPFITSLYFYSLFFQDYHDALVHTLKSIISHKTGEIYLMAPKRGKSMQNFIDKA